MGRATNRLRHTWWHLWNGRPPEPEEDEPVSPVSARALDLVLRVGELLVASGETTERVNEAMLSLALAYELPRCEVQVTFTGVTVSAHPGGDEPPVTGVRSIRRRTQAYARLMALHRLVQDASIGLLDLEEAHGRFRQIKTARQPYPPWLLVTAFGLIAAAVSLMWKAGPLGAVTAFGGTVLADRAATALSRRGVAEFFQFATAAAIGATTAVLVVAAGAPIPAPAIVTGTIVALLPGRPLVVSVQDAITGDLVSSAARLLEVMVIVAAIVAGVGLSVYAAVRLGVAVEVEDLPTAPVVVEPVTVFAAAAVSAVFAISLAAPWRVLLPVAVGGALIWVVYVLLRAAETPPVLAAAAASTLIGLLGHYVARRKREPALPYVVPAIGPLLPGSLLYRGMLELNTGTPVAGILSLFEAVSVALALGAGVNLGGELVRTFQRYGVWGSGRSARPAARWTRGY